MQSATTSRRQFLKIAATTAVGTGLAIWQGHAADVATTPLPPTRQITKGPRHHWFAYYDKLEFDSTDRYALGMEVDFEHRSPKPEDVVKIGMVDLQDNDRWIELGETRAWCWQQGCMLQWRPGSNNEILWNDRQDGQYVCHIMDVKTNAKRTIPHPIYSVSPDGQWAIAPDFRRLADVRPGYGYVGIPDPNFDILAPNDTGIFRVDLSTGKQELLFSVADIARLPYPHADLSKHKHWFNHLLVNPDGSRFTFLHRFQTAKEKWHKTRLVTAAADGSDLRVLMDSELVSHFIWRDPEHILAYCKATFKGDSALFLYEDRKNGTIEQIGKDTIKLDGHWSYSPDKRWILYDCYPDAERNQHVYLFNPAQQRRVELGAFLLPEEYKGEWRCDTHPRFSRDGRSVVIDAPHAGTGRQMHLIDVSQIVG